MKCFLLPLLGASATLACSVASAQIVLLNDPTLPPSADGFNITRDLETGLEWLDVDVSAGRTYADLIGTDGSNEFEPGGDFAGFRYATHLELTGAVNGPQEPSLYRSLGVSPFGFSSIGGYSVARQVVTIAGCFGACAEHGYTSGTLIGIDGVTPTPASMEAFRFGNTNWGRSRTTAAAIVTAPNDIGPPQLGNWLVRGATDVDADNDQVYDTFDNCINVANVLQTDADGDNIGNQCDADLNNDCIVNAIDLGLLRTVFFSPDPVADLNVDGVVNFGDLGLMRSAFFAPPGPSGLPGSCP